MPQFRKVDQIEVLGWREPAQRTRWPSAAELERLLAALDDRSGLTRLDREGGAGGEHGWRARVYTRGVELHRNFADALHGGPRAALLAAVAWRDAGRRLAGPRTKPGRRPRVVRAEYSRLCGWLAYRAHGKRYFADGAWGGREAALAAAEAWLREQQECTADCRTPLKEQARGEGRE